jgi:hypothetical protein
VLVFKNRKEDIPGIISVHRRPACHNELKILRGKREILSQGFCRFFAIVIRLVYFSDSQLLA